MLPTGKSMSVMAGACALLAAAEALSSELVRLEPMVVTATRWQEPLSRIAGTVQVIPEEVIRRSPARSVTELLAENAVGFFSEWSPGQTSINLRGGTSDGQGRDYRGQVLVLLNGRRAGTANLSKLSLNDVARIEIVRGPASVAYGSQAMGGVINILTRSGANTDGSRVQVSAGSWSLFAGHAYTAGAFESGDYYLGLGGGRQSDYSSGRGSPEKMVNTSWERWGGLAAAGWDLGSGRLDVTVRSDGSYDTGFRGSSWDIDNYDDRYNQSIDAVYSTQWRDASLNLHGYMGRDTDDFVWGSEVAGFDIDRNTRKLTLYGLRSSVNVPLGVSTDLLAGLDLEQSELRSTRNRVSLTGVESSPAPFDNNQDERVAGLYGELVHRILDDRLTLRGGARYTYGETTSLPTPGRSDLVKKTADYDQFTYSAGASYVLNPEYRVRAGFATGFRAPTATELAADFELVLGGQVRGNPNLNSETSRQVEFGLEYSGRALWADVALFESRIEDQIRTRVVGTAPGGGNLSQFFNSDGDITLRGVDAQINFNLLPDRRDWLWEAFATGTYHFHMKDRGAGPSANTDKPQRIYESQAGVGTRIGKPRSWDVSLSGVYRGSMWYDTEERLLIPEGEPSRDFVHRKGAFWVWNLRGSYEPRPGWRLFAGVNNLFDKNEHPIFIALNKTPFISDPAASNGGRGNSMPGRNYYVGLSVEF